MKKSSLLLLCLFLLFFLNPLHAELVDNGDGTITDTNTGLMWLKNANLAGETMTWEEANAWANNLRYAGYEDWRLPSGENPDGTVCNSRSGGVNCTQTEFWSLYGVYLITVFSPSPFTNIGYRTYWTATEWPANTANAMAQDMEDGGQNDFAKTRTFYAWAVRGGSQPPDLDAPTSLIALSNYDRGIPIAWKAPTSPNLNGYDIYRSTSSGGPFNRIASNVAKTYYRDNSVDNGRTYYYKVKAVYDTGHSGFSNTASAKPIASGYEIYSNWANNAPTIDGNVNTAEWSDASAVDIRYPGVSENVILYVMNNSTHLYMAIEDYSDQLLNNWDNFSMFIDDNFNRGWPISNNTAEGMLRLYWNNSSSSADRTFRGLYGTWPDINGGDWITPSGTNVNMSTSGERLQYEVALDLSTSPLNGAPGDNIGLLFFVFNTVENVFTGLWPDEPEQLSPLAKGVLWSYNPFCYGDVSLASAPQDPILSVAPVVLDFGTTINSLSFQVNNNGNGTLRFNVSPVSGKSWLTSVVPTSGSLGPSESMTMVVTVNRSSLAGTSDSATLSVTSNGGNQNVLINISRESSNLPGNWDYTSGTGNSATVVLPVSANPNIDGVPLQNGDYVGVFTPSGLCCGWKQWQGTNLSLTVWGDDDQTPAVDGFQSGQTIRYRVYRLSEDKEWENVQVAYSQGSGNYAANAFIVLSEFNVLETVCRSLALNAGWNMFSLNVNPDNPDINIVMTPILDDVVIIKNCAGQTFIPLYGINDIGEIQFDEGYQAYCSQAATVDVCGQPIAVDTPIPLSAGWSIVSYLIPSPVDISTALATINSQLVIAKNNMGQTYIPMYGINDIGDMQPGQGYQVYLDAAATLIYPAASAELAQEDQPSGLRKTQTDHFSFTTGTGDNAVVVITTASNPRYSDGSPLETGDEIGVFTTDGMCCGAAEWQGENKALTIWGDNNQTAEQDGFVAGDTLRFRVWKKSTETEHLAEVTFQAGHPVVYQSNGFSVLTDLIADAESNIDIATAENPLAPSKNQLLQNYPNPFNLDTHIPYQLSRPARVMLTIYDLNGRQICTLINEEKSAGHYTATWNATDASGEKVSSGIYLYRLQVEKEVFSHKMILLK